MRSIATLSQELLDAGFTPRQVEAVAKAISDLEAIVRAECEERGAGQRHAAAERLVTSAGSDEHQFDRLKRCMDLLDRQNEHRRQMLGLQLKSLEETLPIHFSTFSRAIANKAVVVQSSIAIWGMVTVAAVVLSALAGIILR